MSNCGIFVAMMERNNKLFDAWSLTHIFFGALLGWVMNPWIALAIMVAYEPLEIFVLYPFFKKFGIIFGYETWRNSLSDIVFNIIGIVVGVFVLTDLVPPPFYLF